MKRSGAEIALDVQRQLESIYEIESEHSVGEFLVDDRALVAAVEGEDGRDIPEKLIVRERGEEIDLALYVDAQVLARLAADDPTRRLTGENLSDYCVLAEGVSHFVYLTYAAARDRPVTLLELELQAEVDKFVSSVFWIGAQSAGRVPRRLRAVLFDEVVFDDQLDAEGLSRYETANRLAMKYCRGLEHRYLGRRRLREMVDEVRRFYRLPREEKLRAAAEPI